MPTFIFIGRFPTIREVKLAIKSRRAALATRFDDNLAQNALAERLRRGVQQNEKLEGCSSGAFNYDRIPVAPG